MRNPRLVTLAISLTTLALVLALAPQGAQAQTRTFRIYGEGVAQQGLPLPGQDPRPHWSLGLATPPLGLHVGAGTILTASADFNPEIGIVGGFEGTFGSGQPYVFHALNGDKLVCDYGRNGDDFTGEFVLTIVAGTPEAPIVEADFLAEFVPRPNECTGRFKGVTGSWTMYAWTEPFALGSSDRTRYGWTGTGKLKYAK